MSRCSKYNFPKKTVVKNLHGINKRVLNNHVKRLWFLGTKKFWFGVFGMKHVMLGGRNLKRTGIGYHGNSDRDIKKCLGRNVWDLSVELLKMKESGHWIVNISSEL